MSQEMSELFSRFEVNREPRWPLLLGLIGASIALHLTLATTVILVPGFRDALNLAALAGRTGYADKAYKRTVIGEEIQMVEVGQKFRYPDGYFATDFASGLPAPTPNPFDPKIISTFTPPKPELTPSPVPSPVPSPSATSPSTGAVAGASPGPVASETAADGKAEPSPEQKPEDDNVLGVNESELNKRPLKDWLARANALKERGMIDLDTVLEMSIDAKLNADCKLEDAKVVQKSGDEQMVDLAKDLAAAIGDSRMLLFLRDPGKVTKEEKALRCDPMPLRFNVLMDKTDFNATVQTEADSPDRANELTRLYNWALAGGEASARIKKKDEEIIFKNTKVTAEGKQIVVHFKMPRQTAGEMLKKQIEPKPAS
jgi:hypothetical protein